MPPGKLAAQAGHAFLEAYLASTRDSPHAAARYARLRPGTKVALSVPTLAALLRAESIADALGVPHGRVTDRGHVLPPHFDGSPVVTALGLGPATRSEVHRITDGLALVP